MFILDHYSWLAVQVRPNFEQPVLRSLTGKGYETFLPTYQEVRQRSDRMKTLAVPLFPGYLFCRTDVRHRLPILTVPAVKDIVGFAGIPAAIDEDEIQAVKRLIQSGLPLARCGFLKCGQRVILERGPLAGLEGILSEIKGKHRVVVSISMLQRSVAAEVMDDWIRPVSILPALSTQGHSLLAR